MTEWGPLSCEVVGRGTVHQWRAVARSNGIQGKVIKIEFLFPLTIFHCRIAFYCIRNG